MIEPILQNRQTVLYYSKDIEYLMINERVCYQTFS